MARIPRTVSIFDPTKLLEKRMADEHIRRFVEVRKEQASMSATPESFTTSTARTVHWTPPGLPIPLTGSWVSGTITVSPTTIRHPEIELHEVKRENEILKRRIDKMQSMLAFHGLKEEDLFDHEYEDEDSITQRLLDSLEKSVDKEVNKAEIVDE